MCRSHFRPVCGECCEITWHFAVIVVMPGYPEVFGRFPDWGLKTVAYFPAATSVFLRSSRRLAFDMCLVI